MTTIICTASFLSTLSLRRATYTMTTIICTASFLSTLSLRRATVNVSASGSTKPNFYPRSPCGERLLLCGRLEVVYLISIHALLAESDSCFGSYAQCPYRFLSTLSLRRATHYDNYNLHCCEISIHALLAESDISVCWMAPNRL